MIWVTASVSALGSVGNRLPSGTIAAGTFNLSAAWNPDFWGLYHRQSEAQRAQLLSQVWAQRAVRLTLVQQVATTRAAFPGRIEFNASGARAAVFGDFD